MASESSARRDRPLSPHLQIYKMQWTATLSILHRLTGVALAFGTLLLVWWLAAAATGADAYATVQGFMGSWIGIVVLIGWSFALYYHLSNGIRHLFWDAGIGLELGPARLTGYLAVIAAAGLTVLSAIIAFAA